MARPANIISLSPKRATRARTREAKAAEEPEATATTASNAKAKVKSRAPERSRKTGKAERTGNPRTNVPGPGRAAPKAAELNIDMGDETDDEIGLDIVKKNQALSLAKTKNTTRSGRGIKQTSRSAGTKSEDDDDELAQSEAPERLASRSKSRHVNESNETTKLESVAKPTRGRPKMVKTSKTTEPDPVIDEMEINNRRTRAQMKQHAEPMDDTATAANSNLVGESSKRKKVTFLDASDSDKENAASSSRTANASKTSSRPAPSTSQAGLKAKPVRKTGITSRRGRKPTTASNGVPKPLSPKKATQIAKCNSSASSDDGDDDELGLEKAEIKSVVKSSGTQTPANPGLSSPVKKINIVNLAIPLLRSIASMEKENDRSLVHAVKPIEGYADSAFMASPLRRLPVSPIKDVLRESPRRGAPVVGLQTSSKLDLVPTSCTSLKASPRKGNLGASLLVSPLKAPSTPFQVKSSLLQYPAKRIVTPFKEAFDSRNDAPAIQSDTNMIEESLHFPSDERLGEVDTSGNEGLNAEAKMEGMVAQDDDLFKDEPLIMRPNSGTSFNAHPLPTPVSDNHTLIQDFEIYEDEAAKAVMRHEQRSSFPGRDEHRSHLGACQKDASSPMLVTDVFETLSVAESPIYPYEISETRSTTSPLIDSPVIPPAAPTPPIVTTENPPSYAYRDCFYQSEDEITSDDSPTKRKPSIFNHELSCPETPDPLTGESPPRPEERVVGENLGLTPLIRRLNRWKTSSPMKASPSPPPRKGIFSPVTQNQGAANYPDIRHLQNKTRASSNRWSSLSISVFPQDSEEETDHDEEEEEKLAIIEAQKDRLQGICVFEKRAPDDKCNREWMDDLIIDVESEVSADGDDICADENAPPQDVGMASIKVISTNMDEPTANVKDQKSLTLPMSITPVRISRDFHRVVHTVSKVPLRPESESLPLKLSRKRSRSNSSSLTTSSLSKCHGNTSVSIQSSSPHKCLGRSEFTGRDNLRTNIGTEHNQGSPKCKSLPTTSGSREEPQRDICTDDSILRGAVVFVDVHTTEGEDASGIFIELLTRMGARCVKTWSWNPRSSLSPVEGADPKEGKVGITHIIYKDGGVRTLEKVRLAGALVKCVGVGWVLDCERKNKWLDESLYTVDSTIIPRGGAKRRKSMQPRALSNNKGSATLSGSGRSTGADRQTMEEFMKLSPNTPLSKSPDSQSEHKADRDQLPKTPARGECVSESYYFDSIGMSPTTPYYLSQGAKLTQQTCPPKQTRRGLFPVSGSAEGDQDEYLRVKLETARRKSLIFKPKIGSPLGKH